MASTTSVPTTSSHQYPSLERLDEQLDVVSIKIERNQEALTKLAWRIEKSYRKRYQLQINTEWTPKCCRPIHLQMEIRKLNRLERLKTLIHLEQNRLIVERCDLQRIICDHLSE